MAQVYALLADGTTVEIRPAGQDDFNAVKAIRKAISPDNTYMRFFDVSRLVAEVEARRISEDPVPGQVALLALAGDEVVGLAGFVSEVPEQAGSRSGGPPHAPPWRRHAAPRAPGLVRRQSQIATFAAETLTETRPC